MKEWEYVIKCYLTYSRCVPKCNTKQSRKLFEFLMTWKAIYNLMLKLGFRRVGIIWPNFCLNYIFAYKKTERKHWFNKFFWSTYYVPDILPVNSPWDKIINSFYFFFMIIHIFCVSILILY